MFGDRNGFVLGNLTIPQGGIFAFAEFLLTTATTQVTDVAPTVDFSNYQIGATFLETRKFRGQLLHPPDEATNQGSLDHNHSVSKGQGLYLRIDCP